MSMLGFLAALGFFLDAASAASLEVVHTDKGMVQGTNHEIGQLRYMDVFKGIPFAAPPNLFEKPVPHPGWSDVLNAEDFSPKCLQLILPLADDTHGSVDCLYLNIWVPQGESVSTDLPVMIFLHGGAFLYGSAQGDENLHDGTELAARGNVIVVTVNYRVGTLGFLSMGNSEIPGNYGMWDQQAAIAWVHRNIKAFGGDPDNITIFGQSAGAASANLQILSPHNKGLIRRAISQSGNALASWAVNRNPRTTAKEIAQKVDCPTDEGMAGCLRTTDPAKLTLAGTVDVRSSASDPVVYRLTLSPVIDGDFLPADPSALFSNTADIDYLVGVNNMDGHSFAEFDVPSINDPLVETPVSDVKDLLTALTSISGPEAYAAAFEEYTTKWGDAPNDSTIKKTIVEIETDYLFLVPAQLTLRLHNKHAYTARTYSYLFTEPKYPKTSSSWMGADHSDDLQYVFGKPFSTPLDYLPKHRRYHRLSEYIIAYWTNFARTGNPNQGASKVPVEWPLFTVKGKGFMDINNDMNQDSVKQRLRSSFVNIWVNFPNIKQHAS